MVPLREMGSDGVEGTQWWTFRRGYRWSKFPFSDFFKKNGLCMQERVKLNACYPNNILIHLFLFMNITKTDYNWIEEDGLYHSVVYENDIDNDDDYRVKIILLDTSWNRDAYC